MTLGSGFFSRSSDRRPAFGADAGGAQGHATAAPIPEAPPALPPAATHDEVIDGYGEVTVVTGFQPGIDRLVLDFDPEMPLPEVTFDMALEPGSTAVMGNGLLMVVLRGTTGMSLDDVVLQEAPGLMGFGQAPAEADDEIQDQDENDDDQTNVPFFANFDPEQDVIELSYDPDLGRIPEITIRDFDDGTGATVFMDGRAVMRAAGAQGLDPGDVVLVPRKGQG